MPGIGEFQLPGRSLHEPGAELVFQFLNAPADRISGDSQSATGLGETAEAHNLHEQADVVQVEHRRHSFEK
jgi:hypothetical protein